MLKIESAAVNSFVNTNSSGSSMNSFNSTGSNTANAKPAGPTASSAVFVTKQRRILILTDAPRLVFLDPVGNIVRGNLELTSVKENGKIQVKMVH